MSQLERRPVSYTHLDVYKRQTLGRIKEHNLFVPGDRILLKCGSVFRGEQLAFQGMGSAEQPIEISSYGEGELPRLEGNGEVENVISLYNQQYIHCLLYTSTGIFLFRRDQKR